MSGRWAFSVAADQCIDAPPGSCTAHEGPPEYLAVHYWWAYVHPWAVKLFERQWLVNLILWGQYGRLRDAALVEFGDAIGGTTLQVAFAYGDLTNRLCNAVATGGGEIDIVDVLPIQLRNLKSKLPPTAPLRLLAMDSSRLRLPDAIYDRALVFFLLHEQPDRYRELTLSEVFRAVKLGGKLVCRVCRPNWGPPSSLFVGSGACTPRTLRTRSVAQGDQSLVFPWLHTADSQEIIFRAGLYEGRNRPMNGAQ